MPSTIAASTTCPCPEARASITAAEDPEGEQHAAAAEVADHVQRRGRLLARPPEVRERAGDRDVVDVVPGGLGQGPVLTPAGHAGVDERGVASQARFRADAEAFGDAGPEALEERVGGLDEAQDGLDPLGLLQVDADRAAVPIDDGDAARVAAPVDRLDPMDPQHVGALVGEQHRREGTRADPDQLHHLQARQGTRHAASHCRRRNPMFLTSASETRGAEGPAGPAAPPCRPGPPARHLDRPVGAGFDGRYATAPGPSRRVRAPARVGDQLQREHVLQLLRRP